MTTPFVTIERSGALLDVVLDRPDNGNLIDAAMSEAIIEAVTTIDDDVKLVRILSSGPDFCKGRQSPMPPKDAKPSAETLRRVVAAPPLALYDALKAVRVPVVSVVLLAPLVPLVEEPLKNSTNAFCALCKPDCWAAQ